MRFQSVRMYNGEILDGEKIGELVTEIINKFSEEGLSCNAAKVVLSETENVLCDYSTIKSVS